MSPGPTAGSPEIQALQVLRSADQVAALLPGHRVRLLEELRRPDSAAGLSRRLGFPRQQVNYHLRELERVGLVELIEERKRGNCTERVLRATARCYVISPEVLGGLGEQPGGLRDHFSSDDLVAAAAGAIRDLGELCAGADAGAPRPTTMTIATEVRFHSDADRDGFARELSDAVAHLIVKYHGAEATTGSCYRLLLAAYPSVRARRAHGSETDGET